MLTSLLVVLFVNSQSLHINHCITKFGSSSQFLPSKDENVQNGEKFDLVTILLRCGKMITIGSPNKARVAKKKLFYMEEIWLILLIIFSFFLDSAFVMMISLSVYLYASVVNNVIGDPK